MTSLVNSNYKWRWFFKIKASPAVIPYGPYTFRQLPPAVRSPVMSLVTCVKFLVGKTVLGDFAFMYESRSMYMLMASTCLWARINSGIWEKTLHLESVRQSPGCLLWNFLGRLSLPCGAWALGHLLLSRAPRVKLSQHCPGVSGVAGSAG